MRILEIIGEIIVNIAGAIIYVMLNAIQFAIPIGTLILIYMGIRYLTRKERDQWNNDAKREHDRNKKIIDDIENEVNNH